MAKFDKINILLVEDNPGQFGLPVDAFNERENNTVFDSNLIKCNIPTVDFDILNADYNQFNLKVLQHPVEIKEFIDLYADTLNAFGEAELGKLDGIVPDLIVFDYAFGENIETNKVNKTGNIHYTEEYYPIRDFINPNITLQEKLKTNRSSHKLQLEANNNYTENDFIADINFLKSTSIGGDDANSSTNLNKEIMQNDKAIISDDQIGLFSGLSIYSMFRNHHTIAIPATHNATEIKKMNFYAKYLEWLYRSEMQSVFDEEVRGQKTWDSIIPKAMYNFRLKIISLANKYALSFSLDNLYQFTEIKDIQELENLGLQVHSKYGIKNYSIKTLFVDVNKNLVDKVKNYAEDLLKIFQVNSTEYIVVKANYLKIWNTYTEHFLNIYDLSEFTLKEKYLESSDFDKEHCNKLLRDYTINGDYIKEIQTSVFEIEIDKLLQRKIVILLVTKLYIQFAKARLVYNKGNETNLLLEPRKEEYAYLLSPIRSEYIAHPLILEAHRMKVPNYINTSSKNELRKTKENLRNLFSTDEDYIVTKNAEGKETKKLKKGIDFFNFDNFTPTEKAFVKSYFSKELILIPKKYYPKWLK